MEGFKTALSVLGAVILVLFVSFCIGMCVQNFRDKVYNVMDVVPETEYISINEYNKLLTTQLTEQEHKLLKMTSDKVALEQELKNMESEHTEDLSTIANYRTQIDVLNAKINELNITINALKQTMLDVSKNINNLSISFDCISVNIEYPVFDANNSFIYYTGSGDSQGRYWNMSGTDLKNQWNNHYLDMIDSINNNLTNNNLFQYPIRIHTNQIYQVVIDNDTYNICVNDEDYIFDSNTNFDVKVVLNGIELSNVNIDDVIQDYLGYRVVFNIDYTLNEYNIVTNCVLNFVVTTI